MTRLDQNANSGLSSQYKRSTSVSNMSKTPNTQSQNKHAGRVLSATGAKHSQTNNKSVRKTHTVDGMAQISRNSGGHHATDMGRRGMSGHREHQGEGMHQGGTGGGREKRRREGSSRGAKTKKPREDPKGGSPSAFDSMD